MSKPGRRGSFELFTIELAKRHGIADRDKLEGVIDHAQSALIEADEFPVLSKFDRRPDTLDELVPAIERVIALLDPPLDTESEMAPYPERLRSPNTARLMKGLFELSEPERRAAPHSIADLKDTLRVVQRLAQTQHRKPNPGRLPKPEIRAATSVLVEYWTGTIKRQFTASPNHWASGRGGRPEPLSQTTGERFVFDILDFLIPERASELRSIVREFT